MAYIFKSLEEAAPAETAIDLWAFSITLAVSHALTFWWEIVVGHNH